MYKRLASQQRQLVLAPMLSQLFVHFANIFKQTIQGFAQDLKGK